MTSDSQQSKRRWAYEPGPLRPGATKYDMGIQANPSHSTEVKPLAFTQQRFSPIMNRQHRSATVGSDGSPPREIPEAVYGRGSPLARTRANRRRSTLHDIVERSKKQPQGQSIPPAAAATTSPAASYTESNGRPLSTVSAQSLPHDAGLVSAREVHQAELHFRMPSPPGESKQLPQSSLGLLKQSSKPSLMQKRAEKGLKALSASRASRESMERGSATPSSSMDRLATNIKRSENHHSFRIERTYRITDRSKDSDHEADDKASDTSPSSSPLSAVFTLPPVQQPPPQKNLPPLPAKLQNQLQQLPRLSPPRKLPLSNKPALQLGLPEPGLPISPGPGSQSSNRRVVSGSSILRSPSKASFNDAHSTQNLHMGPHPPASAKIGKGQASEVFRRVGYWLYSTAPVQFIKHAMVEERNDSVNVLFSTDRSIWILGVSYRLKKNSKHVMLPVSINADGSHLQMDSSLFLTHHHQRRSGSPSRGQRGRKQEPATPQRRSEDIPGNRRRANTSGAMMNKKKLQIITQLQNYPGMPQVPEPGTPAMTAKQGMRTLASIPSQDLLCSRESTVPPSPLPFPDEPMPVEHVQSAVEPQLRHESSFASTTPSSSFRKPSTIMQPHLQTERPKSSRMDRLRSWVARTAKPIRRKSDVATEQMLRDNGPVSSAMINSITSRPSSPQPSRLSSETPRTATPTVATAAAATGIRGMSRAGSSIASSGLASGTDPRSLGINSPHGSGMHLRKRSKEVLGGSRFGDGGRRSWNDSDVSFQQRLPPIPHIPDPNGPPATAGVSDRIPSGRYAGTPVHRRPRSSHSNATSQRRVASNASGNPVEFGRNRRETAVRSLVSDFASWESPSASIMMFQREWKLPSFQQLVTVQSATAWAKESGWTVTLSSETFFMAYIFYNLPSDAASLHAHTPGEKISGDRLLLRMRLAMEDIEGKAVAGEAWRDAITAIIVTIDARIAPKCTTATAKRNFSQSSAETEQQLHSTNLSPEDHIKRMKMLEKHLAKVTESFANHFWPKSEDHGPMFNTYPRRRTDEVNAAAALERRHRRARGWNMIPTLLTFKSDEREQPSGDKSPQSAQQERSESPTLSVYTRRRHLYPMGLSIASTSDNIGMSAGSSHEMSAGGSAAVTPERQSPSQSPFPSRPSSPINGRAISPARSRNSGHSQLSGGNGRPSSPVHKRGTLGLYSSNDVNSLSDELGQSLNVSSKQPPPPLHSTSSQSSGGSSGFYNFSAASTVSRQPTAMSTGSNGGQPQQQQQQRKRKAGEAGVVGKTKGGFEVVWSASDNMSTSYVMVPVPKATAESPTKMLKQHHSRLNVSEADSTGTQSQPNLKRVLESITREINLDSSYVLLLPPPPPIDIDANESVDDEDEFGYLATTLLRRVKSEMVIRRTMQDFEHDYGLDLVDASDSDSFQMVDSDGNSSRNSVYFSAEDDTAMEPETWYKRLSASSSQHHLPARYRTSQQGSESEPGAKPLSLNQLTLLEFFMDGMRRFYYTYRKGFPTITPSFYTSDMGWGCTYRTCQMMLAESFARVLLGRFWDPFRLSASERSRHGRIIEWFHDADLPQAFYSIHRMARTATEMDKRIGDWLGPSIAAHVMKRLSMKHPRCPLTIHVAIDQTVYASEVRKQALAADEAGSGERPAWRPLLLLVPVRLGLSRLNLGYIPKIKTLFQIPQSVGLVGGKPSRSFYFIGRQGDSLFYLDPHVTRQHVPRSGSLEQDSTVMSDSDSDSSDFEMFGIPETDEYHTTHICTMPIHRLDPSMLLGFLFNTESEWDTFVMAATDKESQRSICTGTSPLFTLLSGSSMMTPQFDAVVQQPIPGHTTRLNLTLDTSGRKSPRVNSDSQVPSPRLESARPADVPIAVAPPLTRGRSASSPRFSTADVDPRVESTQEMDDEFEML
ncbi:hypothetical protein LPJ78_002302 [Coemansia sp. RSA 989]|nr:hypothetical protein LPJ78_002302 [Coemansia sp. RSA 989]